MKLFLDANVLVAVLNKEYPLFSSAARIVSLADDKKFQLYTSPICLAIAFYFAEKKSGTAKAKQKIALLVSKIGIADTDRTTVLKAIANKSIDDVEDGFEYYSALRAGCKCIITEDKDDFHFSEIRVLNSKEFIESISKN
jgi:predicted nucleic acid-binding protein